MTLRGIRTNSALHVVLLTAAIFHLLIFAAGVRGPLGFLRDKLIDGFYVSRYAALKDARGTSHPDAVLVVSVDDESLRMLGERWPWSRKIFADFLDRIQPSAPSTVALDFSFAVPSPRREEDSALEAAIQRSGVVVLSAYEGAGGKLVRPIPQLERPAAAVGVLNTLRDPDNVNRRFRLWWPSGSGTLESFSAAIVSQYRRSPAVPDDRVRWAVYDRRPEDLEIIPFWRFIQDNASAERVRGKIVLVGATGEIFHDMYGTPLGTMPGVIIHANQVLSLLEGRRVIEPDAAAFKTAALAFALAAALVFFRLPPVWGAVGFAATLAGLDQAARTAFTRQGFLAEPLVLYVAILAPAVAAFALRWARLLVENRGLRRQSSKDGLTDLYTYRYMEAKLIAEFDRAMKTGTVLSFVIFDIDHFKKLNDAYGHEKGNEILVAFARILKANTRGDDLVARYGGEEFCLVLPHRPKDEALQIADRIRVSLEQSPFRFVRKGETGSSEIHATVSAGISSSDTSGVFNGKELLRLADSALLLAKANGRNRIEVYKPGGSIDNLD